MIRWLSRFSGFFVSSDALLVAERVGYRKGVETGIELGRRMERRDMKERIQGLIDDETDLQLKSISDERQPEAQ